MENIAVVGIANLFPGSKAPEEFWQQLLKQQDCRSKATANQMGVDPSKYFGQKGDTDKYYCMHGGYINAFDFDAKGFALDSTYLEQMDDGFIRLFSGDPLQVPVADLNISAEGLKLVAISNKSLSYCGGKTVIPDTLGMTIQDARDKLFKSGFFAIYHEQDPTSWTNKYYPGINELAGCSSGIPWCYFEYVEQNSRLTLLTLGSDEVIRADVLCD